jgi:hypothetical protein
MSSRDRLTGPSNTGVWYFTDAMGRDPFATGIASIFHRHPGPMLQADHVCIKPVSTDGPFVLDWNALEAPAATA